MVCIFQLQIEDQHLPERFAFPHIKPDQSIDGRQSVSCANGVEIFDFCAAIKNIDQPETEEDSYRNSSVWKT